MNHVFEEEKATQAAAYFASRFSNKINYTKLMKLLYLVDREALKKWGRPVVGGPYVAMDNGPLSSPAYDAVKSSPASTKFPVWSSVFRKSGYDVEQVKAIEFDALSKAEIGLLQTIFETFGGMNQWELIYYTHVNCPEWHDPQGTSVPISESAILEQVGRSPEEIACIQEDAKRSSIFRKINARA